MSLVSIPEGNHWIVSYKNGKIIGDFTDERVVGTFTKESCIVETPTKFLSEVDERIYHRQLEINKLREMRDKLLLNPENNEHYENLANTQLFCYRGLLDD